MTRDARFYFANLGADVARCAQALERHDEKRYQKLLATARRTLERLRESPSAFAEGELMLQGLELTRDAPASFRHELDCLIVPLALIPSTP
ncbi:hypothetical protein A3E65_01285 [Candidatus Kaiserbacteria bacterium RIFCSPHIGHO2_12_FULL_56_13]|uniref:Uncharacterized protein n=2 Tax=Candidatus Kaiseribacteriota TaxID=1752734 RepID=A0A1F6E4Y1_9BACT|nr:MAG: hypothetical protein A3C95_01275 [Candidatus Kaiserbacteria bacterium RIFCSPHIGHO2_02_FULL_56_30]OGG72180.1 MAG: hypothetical protein A3E65_01285 [Candidatus Kaiserbacteria bacterium RIFCSPHIGHO2_12_FULL_56_13]